MPTQIMSPFWASLFDYLRLSGRNATLFLVTLAGIVGLCILAAIIQGTGLDRYWIYVVPPLAIGALAWNFVEIRRARARRRDRLPRQPLSPNELHAAFLKLKK